MNTLNWINFLHIYQPPTQDLAILTNVTNESYVSILKLLETYPKAKITLNISGSLLELWLKNKQEKIISDFKKFAEDGRIELTGSAMYHPILSLLPESEIKRQIELDDNIHKKYFGNAYKPSGFFIPEMAYSEKVAKMIGEAGFKWILLDEAHFPTKEKIDVNIKYKIKNTGLYAVFRSRKYSKSFPPELISKTRESYQEKFLITAHDGEMYGHWHKDVNDHFRKVFEDANIENMTVSEYLRAISKEIEISPREANWESTDAEMEEKNLYALWKDPRNKIHHMLWGLAEIAIATVSKNQSDKNFEASRNHLDKGLASCAWWWASEKKPDVFSPLTWNPTEIEKGAKELLSSIRSLESIEPEIKLDAEKRFSALRDFVWEKHWQKK